ncbi:ATP-binding protein [Terasakiella sp.]|uniref:ATP-binding protein n=1 Tax=Terasakiella sp. TaxID=2034861 RepID=UPI003AA9D692
MTLIIAFSSLITFFITAIQLFVDYTEQRNDLDVTLNSVTVNVPTISGSVWSFDEEQILLSLEGLVNLRNIEHVVVKTENGKSAWEAGAKKSEHVIERAYPLIYDKRGEQVNIGSLNVVASLDQIYERVFSKALGILLSNGVKTFFVALFMFAIFYRLVARRLGALAEKVESITQELAQSDIDGLYEHDPKDDEIQSLRKSFDHMGDKLRATFNTLAETNKSLQHAYEEVQTINSQLELRVHERTQHLSQEIVEREYVQQSLKNSEQRLRDIAESASDWFWETGENHCFTYVSSRCYEVTGLSQEDILGKQRHALAAYLSPDYEPDIWQAYDEILRNELPLEDFRYRLKTRNGQIRVIELSGRPYYDTNNQFMGYRGAARDVTDQVHYQEQLQKAKEKADVASKAKSEFISSMSHELRTPLNGILGFAQLLVMNPKKALDKQQALYVDQILGASNHLLTLINEILDLSKVEAGKINLDMEVISPIDTINDNIDLLEAAARDYEVSISTNYDNVPPDVQIIADVTRFSQVLMNLCFNAIKYNRPQGRVEISLSVEKKRWLRIKVTDTGNGLTSDQIDQLFTPFNRLGAETTDTEGTGVGLSISQKLVHLMQGQIGVESTPGVGSTFWFEFEVVQASPVQHQEATIAFSLNNQRLELLPCRVLYVEDNPENMMLVREIFDKFDQAELLEAQTAEEGLELASTNQLDLILMDLNLPGMDGFQALNILKRQEETKDIPVFALSANVHPDTIRRGIEEGFQSFLTKPVDIVALIKTVNSVLTA